MHSLGATRTRVTRNYAFIAPDGHVPLTLPGWTDTQAVIVASPQLGARFTHYLAAMQPGAVSGPPLAGVERFIYVIRGAVELERPGATATLQQGGFAYLPAAAAHTVRAETDANINVFERRYVAEGGLQPPPAVIGDDSAIPGEPFLGDPHLICKKLLPEDPAFDLAVNTMTFEPGATLPFVETHFMEHGLLMLAGSGIYRLGEQWHPVQVGDAIWMGPFCPQWFGALGRDNASYLLYKEANRDVFAFERES